MKKRSEKKRESFSEFTDKILIFEEEKSMVALSANKRRFEFRDTLVRARTIMINVFNLDLLQLNVFIRGIYKLRILLLLFSFRLYVLKTNIFSTEAFIIVVT